VELEMKRHEFEIEQEFLNKLLKAGVMVNDGSTKMNKLSRPGFGKFDLDTGLSQSEKQEAR
jgi:hypothetical protein